MNRQEVSQYNNTPCEEDAIALATKRSNLDIVKPGQSSAFDVTMEENRAVSFDTTYTPTDVVYSWKGKRFRLVDNIGGGYCYIATFYAILTHAWKRCDVGKDYARNETLSNLTKLFGNFHK